MWVGEKGDVRTYSYFALNRDVSKFANVLKAMGVKRGDRVTIYMAARARNHRRDAGDAPSSAPSTPSSTAGSAWTRCTAASTTPSRRWSSPADGGFMNGKVVELKQIDRRGAHAAAPTVETVIVVQRTGHDVKWRRAATTGTTIS